MQDLKVSLEKMRTTRSHARSVNGLKKDLCVSGLQKYIRRGEKEKALRCALEVDLFAYAEEGKGEPFRANLIHRLMVIALEDCGAPFFENLLWMDERIDLMLNMRKERKGKEFGLKVEEGKALVEMVECMCESEHSREFSHIRALLRREFQPYIKKMEFGVELEECKNVEGYKEKLVDAIMKGDVACFYYGGEILKLEPKSLGTFYRRKKTEYFLFYIFEEVGKKKLKGMELENFMKIHKLSMKWFHEIGNLKEKFLCWYLPLYILCFNNKLKEYKVDEVKRVGREEEEVVELYKQVLDGNEFMFDEYVKDMHTRDGREVGKGGKEFALNGSFVKNEWKGVNQDWKNIYRLSKLEDWKV